MLLEGVVLLLEFRGHLAGLHGLVVEFVDLGDVDLHRAGACSAVNALLVSSGASALALLTFLAALVLAAFCLFAAVSFMLAFLLAAAVALAGFVLTAVMLAAFLGFAAFAFLLAAAVFVLAFAAALVLAAVAVTFAALLGAFFLYRGCVFSLWFAAAHYEGSCHHCNE